MFAVIAVSSLAFSAANYLASQGVPVIGIAEDGPEWTTATNMFSITGALHGNLVATTQGQFLKMEGVTTIGTLGYSISPASAEAAKGVAASARAAGIKIGYVNASFPFGSTNVEPVALAMKSAGVDGATASVDPNTSYALIAALRQAGVNLKVFLLPTGYGADVLQAGPGALQTAQNVYFLLAYEPIEMHTPATEQFQAAMKTYAGVKVDPTLNQYIGFLSVVGFVDGLKAAGANPTQAKFIDAMLGIRDWNASGLFGSHSIGFAMNQRGLSEGADNCIWITRFSGTTFHLVPGADPICGKVIPGKTVSPVS